MSLPQSDPAGRIPEPNPVRQVAVAWLEKRGVTSVEIAELVLDIQKGYVKSLTLENCLESVERVLDKREVLNAILTGLSLDVMAERGLLEEPLLTMLRKDDGLYGIDEIMALSVVNIYGSIGLTNFGYLDKVKLGIVGRANTHANGQVNTFLDDLISAIAAAAAARIAHRDRDGTLR